MSKVTNKQKIILEKVDPEMTYSMADALEILKSVKSSKFEESVDIAIRLGVDPNKSDQNVRGAVTLPNSLGKQVTVAVFADGDQAEAAKAAGAEYIGMEDLAEKFSKEEISVDVVISTNAAMKVVGKLGQVLGPKGLMPNPKTGTVSDDVATAINNVKAAFTQPSKTVGVVRLNFLRRWCSNCNFAICRRMAVRLKQENCCGVIEK